MATRMLIQTPSGFSLLQYASNGVHYLLDGKAEVFEQLRPGRRFTVAIDADHGALEPDILAPVVADTGFDCDLGQSRDQDHVPVHRRLAVERRGAGHRHDPNRNALLGQLLLRAQSELDFRPGGEDDRLGFLRVRKNVAAAADRRDRMSVAFLKRYVLPRKQ